MQKTGTYLLALAVLTAAPSPEAAGQDRADNYEKALAELQGEWQYTSRIADGKKAPPETVRDRFLKWETEKLFLRDDKGVRELAFTIDPEKKLRWIDLLHVTTGKGIYKIDGDTLTICSGRERPTDFTANAGSGRTLITLKRISRGPVPFSRARDGSLLTLDGPYAYSVAFRPDGKQLATGGLEQVVLWDALTGKRLRSLPHKGSVNWLAFSPGGDRLYAADSRTVKVWGPAGEELLAFPADNHFPFRLLPDGKRLAGLYQNQVTFWDTATGKKVRTAKLETADRAYNLLSPDGKRLAELARKDSAVFATIWDVNSGARGRTIKLGPVINYRNGVAFSPDGRLLVSVHPGVPGLGLAGEVGAWQVETGKEVYRAKNRLTMPGTALFTPDGKSLLLLGEHEAQVWEAATGKERFTLRSPTSAFATRDVFGRARWGQYPPAWFSFSADGKRLATIQHPGHTRPIPGKRELGKEEAFGIVKVWDTGGGREAPLALRGHGATVRRVVFSPDGKRLASASEDKTAGVWDARTGARLLTLKHDGLVLGVAFSPDGKWVATAGGDKKACIWDSESGKLLRTLEHRAPVSAVAFHPKGKLLATSSVGKGSEAAVWGLATGKKVWAFPGGWASLAFDPEGKVLAVGADPEPRYTYEKHLFLLDAETGKATARSDVFGHLPQLTFSPDGKRLAVANRGRATILDARREGWKLQFVGHGKDVMGVAFSPDGKRLATAGLDGTVRLWGSVYGTQLSTLAFDHSLLVSVAFSPDGRRLATAGGGLTPSSFTVLVWELAE